jgi:hypothetical protein
MPAGGVTAADVLTWAPDRGGQAEGTQQPDFLATAHLPPARR